ncbi:MAG: hypothetical protein C0604_09655, partial [Clostridiales bacterium]
SILKWKDSLQLAAGSKRLKTRAKINAVESWSVGQLERKSKDKRKIKRLKSFDLMLLYLLTTDD